MINPVIKDKVSFDRINDPAVTAYVVKVHEQINGQTVSSVLMTIQNPKTVNPTLTKESFVKSDTKRYQLTKKNIIKEITYPIRVFINGKRLSPALIFHNNTTNMVTIDYDEIELWDSIEIEYYFDGVEFMHTATNSCTYSIELDVDYSMNTVGDHNVLV